MRVNRVERQSGLRRKSIAKEKQIAPFENSIAKKAVRI
jgi:hypothetical protein